MEAEDVRFPESASCQTSMQSPLAGPDVFVAFSCFGRPTRYRNWYRSTANAEEVEKIAASFVISIDLILYFCCRVFFFIKKFVEFNCRPFLKGNIREVQQSAIS